MVDLYAHRRICAFVPKKHRIAMKHLIVDAIKN